MYHLRKLKSLLLLLCFAVTAQAQLSNGKVYNFVNVGNPGKSMTSATAGNYLSIATTDQTDYSQLWYVASDGNGFTLRNLGNGNYLRSPNAGGNTNWTLVKTVDGDNCRFSCTQVSGHDVLRAINTTESHHYMHYGATTGTVVCWTSSAPATQWDFMEVSGITSDELNANWESLAAINPSDAVVATYQTALDNLFSDKACTTLKKSFANEDAVKNDADYKALPTTLQQMVLKVYKNSWAEDNYDANKSDWDAAYAKKYRVQLYEPYNEPEAAAAALGLNAHTNLNNPTGIFSGGREAMYVMVEGEIKEGASLYLASYSGHGKLGGYQNGVELKPGLNVVPSYFAGNNYCINYVVHTFDTEGGTKKGNKAKARKLSDYEDLKIHIEGGHINGYWNKMGDYRKTGSDVLYTPDKNADWDYIAARATQTDVTVLGEYITLQFPLHEALNSDGGTEQGLDYYYTGKNIIESSIQEWDNVMMWERIVLGVLDKTTTEDAAKNPKSPYAVVPNVFAYIGDDTDGFASGYGDYYNVHGLSFGTPSGYMYGGWDHCGYHFNTMGAIMTSMITDAGSHWGPAHEIGHQHQGLLTVNGLTEVTNNLFSNVVLWYYGKTTSRVNGSALEPIAEMFANEEADFFNTTSNVFITTQMYYKLFLYYHVLGHNPKFYPKLFEMLRQDPMSTGYNQRGATSILHFYKKCCEAAGEDLTEFFRAYGFFRVMTNRLVGDYANSVYDQTQEDIDDAIAEVKALAETKGWEENIAVLFINDDTGGQILSHRDDLEYLAPYEGADSELGSYATYSDVTAPNYTYTIVGTTVTMEGEGGIGFAIFNEKGELIGFSDNKTFEVSVECAEAIASGKAEVKTMKGDNEAVEAVNIMDTDDTDAKRAMLGELVESAKAVLDLSDEDGTKVGFYRASSLEALESAYTQAKQVYDDRTVASYSAVYNALFHEYFEVMNNAYARIGLVEGNAYRLTNKNYPDRSLSIPTDSVNKQMMGEITDTESPYDQQLWYFEASETEGSYYLKNKNTSTYPGNVETSTFIYATATSTSDAHAYKLRDMGNGLWALEGNTALHLGAANYKFGVLGWGADATASQWYITAVDVNENAEALFSLQGMVEKTKDLAGEMANVQYSGKLALQAVSESEPYYLSTNACHNTLNNASDGQGLAGLLDDDTETFFHSDYGGKISNTHYLQVDLGSGNTMSKFAFNYTTRSNGNNCPTAIEVAGSNSADGTFTTLQTYTAASDGLPNGKALSWESPVIENTGNYRYLRFSVTATENSKIYFVMSTFGITNHETVVKSIEEKYSTAGLTEQTLKNLGEELFEANELMASDAATVESLQAMCSSIEESYYTPLLAIYNNANAARLTALKGDLSVLIGQTTNLIEQCGTVTVIPAELNGALSLQTTTPNGGLYLSTNAQESEERNIKYLIDSDDATFFHSAWSWDVEATHYLQVDLGEGKSLREFAFTYKTAASGPFPYTIKVYGSNEDNYDSFQKNHLATFSKDDAENPLPSSASKEWNSSSIYSTTAYRYLRFEVTNSGASGLNATPKGEYCFVMSYFGVTAIGAPESYTAELKPEAGDAGTDLLIETFKKNAEAQGVYTYATTELQVEAAIAKLQTQYDKLLAAQQSSDKEALRNLVARTTTLIGECGTLSYAEIPTKVNLQAKNSTSNLFLSCPYLFYDMNDNPGDSDTDCADLLDGNTDTYIHTNYNALLNTYPHYLQVAFGASEIPLQFKFSYSTRHNGANQVPKHIVVKGSNDGVNFDEFLAEFDDESDGMPTTMNTSWTAPNDIIGYYKYLRFYVTESPQTNPYFAMSEFSMSYTGYAIKWNNAQHGTATNAHLIAAYEARNAANELLATTTTKEALQAATTELQEKYDELYNALYGKDFTISSNIAGGGVRYKDVDYTTTLSAPSTLTPEALIAMPVDGYVAKSITINGATISVVYNKEYTVTITGGEGEGRVTFGDVEYANDGTFDALQNSFTAADLTATDVEGYTKSVVTVNHETGAISVTYTLDKSALNDLLGDTYTLIYACNGFVNSEFVTATLLEETYAAWITAQNALETVQTRSELNDALNDLQAAHDKLNAAKTSAEQEAAERTELNGQLNTLIAETETLITSCYENEVLKFINSEFVTEETISAVRTLIEAAEVKCETPGTTATEYNASITALTEAKSNLATAKVSAEAEAVERLTSRETLRTKIEALRGVIAECGVIKSDIHPTGTADVPLTEANLSTNAQEKSEGPIENLLKDDDSFFHSSWQAAAGATHYLQVDLGEGKTLQEFVFGYTTRNSGPHPYIIVVSGSNSPDGDFEDIKVFNSALPKTGSTSWEAPAPIKAEEPYRYLRFTVTKSSNLRSYGEYCFAMSKFGLKTITYSENEDYYVESLSPNGSVTEEQLLSAYRTMVEAGELDNEYTTKSDLDAMIETLTTLGNDLESALNTLQLPVELTTDVQNPVLYTFKSKRGNTKALQYEPAANHMLSIADASEGNVKQMFYFTMGDTRTQVYVHPFAAGEQVLAANDLSDGKEKVFAAEMSSTEAMPMQWTFEKDDEWYSLNGVEAPYFSNFGGVSNKMGFYGSKDEGSRFQFTDVDETTVEGSAAYHSLNVYYTEAAKVASSEIVGGSNPYYYPEVEAVAYNKAYAAATDALEAESCAYEDYLSAYKAFLKANEDENFVLQMPEVGKFYRFVSVVKGDGSNAFVYANPTDNKMYWATDKGNSDATAIWKITPSATEGKYNISNLHTGSNINGFIYYDPSPLSEVEGDIEIESLSYNDGQIGLKHNGTMMHAQGGGAIVHWGTGANDGSAWRIVEVTNEEVNLVEFALTIGQYRHASLYLNYATKIPAGVKVFVAHTPNGDTGEIIAEELIDVTVLPAKTAVIVQGDAATYNFTYTTDEYDGADETLLENNRLGGSAYLKYQQVKAEGNRCCVFGRRGNKVGLYKNYIEYIDANGSQSRTVGEGESATTESFVDTDDGTHFEILANKIYFEYNPNAVANASAFHFRFYNKGEGTTTIDELIFGGDSIIYNLSGQRIMKIIEPGVYIVDGKKIYVSEKMILNND